MKILLVRPHPELEVARRLQKTFLHLEPLDLEIVAGAVPEEDDVKILDLGVESKPFEAFQNALKHSSFDLVGFGGYSTHLHIILQLARMVKQYAPSIVTVAGGIHATLLPAGYAGGDIDVIVRGEGGTVLAEIIRRFKAKEPLFFEDRALSPRDPDFLKKTVLPPPVYPAVENIPRPRRDLVDRTMYFCAWTSSSTGRLDTMFPRVASLRTSLGCAFSCTFCVIPHVMRGKYLQRSPKDVVDEIEKLEEDHIYFVDDEMFLNAERAAHIAELLIRRNIKKKYISWARSDTIVKHPDVFKLWKQAGLSTVYVGLESMDPVWLEEYKKRVDESVNRKAIALLREWGIMLHAAFIVNPDFSVADFRRLEKDVIDLCPAEVTFTVLSPSPGTPFWESNRDRFICDPYRFYDCMHSILPTRLPLMRFYQHFGRLTQIALRRNPLRMNRVKIPFRDLVRAIVGGTRYIFSLYGIYRDYLPGRNK